MMRWMECVTCDTMWRGEDACCDMCGDLGQAGNGPTFRGGATYTAHLVEAVAR